jgi:alanine-synthesizing transaminase
LAEGANMREDTFSARLRKAMADKGLKQVDLVRTASERNVKLGKSKLSQYLSGKSAPRPDMLDFLSDVLGVNSAWLAGDEETPQAAPDQPAAEDAASNEQSTKTDTETKKDKPMAKREFRKSSKLDNVLYDVRGPVVDEANRMEEQGIHVLKLNIGNPAPFGFRTPDEVVSDMRSQLTECEGYSASRGLFSARKAIMQYDQLKGIPNVNMEDIYTGNGASELIQLTMHAMVDAGDEVLVPSPDYPLWTACVTLAGGKAVHYICDEKADWMPDIDDIRSKVTPATKAIVVINPNNPTGAVYPREVLEEIVQVARENQLIILADEIYDRLVMDGIEHVSIASLAPDLFCITFNGLSKSHMIAGYRIGWMSISGDKSHAKDLMLGINMLSNMRLCSNVPAQSIVQTALGGHQSVKDYIVPGGRVYEQREFVYNALCDIPGVSVVKPKAAFYIFPKLDPAKFNITDDDQFALDLLRQKKVLIVGGKGFNWQTPGYFRIVYLPRIETLREAMGKLADFLSYYHQ